MHNRTPPLPALRSFAAFARLGSIRAAADELSLTQGAIAHQIRALEDLLEVPLVERRGRRLLLTEQGRVYGYRIRHALYDISHATALARHSIGSKTPAKLIRLSVLPSFATGWLIPRLPGLYRDHPEIRFTMEGSMAYTDVNSGTVDCAVRFGHGNWPEVAVRPLMPDRLLLVASPALLGGRSIDNIGQALRFPMLHSTENWASWASLFHASAASFNPPQNRIEFSDSTHLLEAARCGLGLALTRRSIADHLLQRGELIKVLNHEPEHTSRYHALTPKSATSHPQLEIFLGWLERECRKFSDTHALGSGAGYQTLRETG